LNPLFSEDNQIPYFVKILHVGGKLFHVDGRTYRRTVRQTWRS